jgi:hypothetical protein
MEDEVDDVNVADLRGPNRSNINRTATTRECGKLYSCAERSFAAAGKVSFHEKHDNGHGRNDTRKVLVQMSNIRIMYQDGRRGPST